jgi:hypothetical protein
MRLLVVGGEVLDSADTLYLVCRLPDHDSDNLDVLPRVAPTARTKAIPADPGEAQ